MPDRTWILVTLMTVLVALFRWQDEPWLLVVSKTAMLVGASGLIAALPQSGLGWL